MTKRKLTQEEETKICDLFGHFKTASQIQRILKEENGITISKNSLYYISNRPKNKQVIAKCRDVYQIAPIEVPLATKRGRMERIQELDELTEGLPSKDKIQYGLRCVKESRDEMEGSPVSLHLAQYNQYNLLSNDELIDKKEELKKKIIALVKREGGSYAAD